MILTVQVPGKERYNYNTRVARKDTHYDIDVCRAFKFDDKEIP